MLGGLGWAYNRGSLYSEEIISGIKNIVWKRADQNEFKTCGIYCREATLIKRFDLRSTCKLVIAYFYM